MDSDIPVFDTIKGEGIITGMLNGQGDKNIQQGGGSNRDHKQNESSVNPVQRTVSSIEAFDMVRKLDCFAMKINT
jgi:hypothetical protein